jgi:PAS domain S-box-containing protein
MPDMRAVLGVAAPTSIGDGALSVPRHPDWRPLVATLAIALSYYAGARIGLALTFMPFPLSVLWPPNALLFAALVLAPVRWWWLLLLGALPAHLFAELEANIPVPMVLGWFVSNVSEALIGALLMRRLAPSGADLSALRSVLGFFVAAVVAALLSSFIDAGLVRLIGWGDADFWTLWQIRLFTNIVATLTFVPVIVTCATAARTMIRRRAKERWLEAALLLAGLLTVGSIVFSVGVIEPGSPPSLLYLPLPFLVWAALRFGPPLASASFAIVAFLVIWGAGHGHGPFLSAITYDGALPVQLFLLTIGVPLLLLAALVEERRHGLRLLRASQELFSTAFRAGPDAIAVSRRRDGTVIEANDCWRELLGDGRDEPGQGCAAASRPPVDDPGRSRLTALVRDSPNVRGLELALRDRHGEVRQALVSITAIELQGEACAVSIVHDITELRRAEGQADEQRQQLTHLTRIASLTDFSSTLAHELNQPLTAILSNAQAALRFLARDPPDLSEVRTILNDIADADKRAGLLIHHLRLLVNRGDEAFVSVDVNQMTRETLTLAHGAFVAGGVELSTSLAPDLPVVSGDPVQLKQLLLNLISNACDAMHDQDTRPSRLSVTTSCARADRVRIVVSDTGRGIADEQLERMFEPFVTTKANGLGLGLPICRKIAQAHGGTLAATSSAGEGASFRLELPAQAGTRHQAVDHLGKRKVTISR